MNPLILPLTPSSMTRAQIMKTSATGALEIHVLLPFRVQPSLVRVAVVSIEDGSEPWFGSVKPCPSVLLTRVQKLEYSSQDSMYKRKESENIQSIRSARLQLALVAIFPSALPYRMR